MFPFQSARTDHRSVAYTNLVTNQSYNVGESIEEHHINQLSSNVSDTDGNDSHDSTVRNSMTSPHLKDDLPKTYTGPAVEGWPTAPRKLRGFSVQLLIGDTLLILLPVAFLALGISAWQLNGKELSSNGQAVERAMSLGPTIYPLAFAAISGRCLRSIAVRLAERGTTLLMLERLLGSQSLVSAIGTAWSLRSANSISICLLLLWALSPLGGQSSLRLLHQTNSTVSENGTIYYSNPVAPIDIEEAGNWLPIVSTVLTASLAASVEDRARSVDSWNHPRVPRLDTIEQKAVTDALEETWIDVDSSKNQTYSSWTGINVQGLRQTTHAAFQVKHNYMYLDCPPPSIDTPENTLDGLYASNMAVFPRLARTEANQSASDTLTNVSIAGSTVSEVSSQSFFLRAAKLTNSTDGTPNMTTPWFFLDREPISFLFGLHISGRQNANTNLPMESLFVMYTCSLHIITVDVQIVCRSGDCSVTRLRRIPNESASSLEAACETGPFHRIGCMTNATNTVFQFLRYLPTSVASLFSHYKDQATTNGAFTRWLMGSDDPFGALKLLSLATITDRERINRLTTMLNTYFQGCSWGYQVTRAALYDKPDYPWAGERDSRSPDRWISASDAIFSDLVPVYRADVGWIMSLLLISLILLMLGIVNLAHSLTTIAPDIFYYASSLARENPYTNTPDGGTALSGSERSRLLKNMKLQVADVSPESQYGYVAVKSVESQEDFLPSRLRKDRMYW
ncbi:uncharacterized protein M421DRAFT_398148 [Didymella exigua CBS 183.55]|uniref:Uncharacterized protein n=1 Tax=Didymella exigua CBS 183.55 TaxID=1150837 RepID=A0A6A5RBK2_9PLEO|nr:uncharacterized protein M421DRAFT_398148 [Didymella exigua CBS 183.55]KAF1925615.1 hypothetical protein M421DRAFT_398148 [Didymella exigua CBS 183.55]